MNRSDMADLICGKVRTTDADSISICKDFLTKRHEMIYEDQLWRDSLAQVTVTYDPDDTNNAAGIYLLPRIVGMIVYARSTNHQLTGENVEIYYRMDLDRFTQTGTPVEFFELKPVCYLTQTAKGMYLDYDSTSDNNVSVYARYVASAENNKKTIALATPSATSNILESSGITAIEAFTKPATVGAVYIKDAADGSTLLTLGATETRYEPYPILRVLDIPTEDTAIKVLCKQKLIAWDNDYDEPQLRGIDDMLIEFVQGDMLEYQRQYGKAQVKYQLGTALLEQYKKQQVVQRVSNPRMIPFDDGNEIPMFLNKSEF